MLEEAVLVSADDCGSQDGRGSGTLDVPAGIVPGYEFETGVFEASAALSMALAVSAGGVCDGLLELIPSTSHFVRETQPLKLSPDKLNFNGVSFFCSFWTLELLLTSISCGVLLGPALTTLVYKCYDVNHHRVAHITEWPKTCQALLVRSLPNMPQPLNALLLKHEGKLQPTLKAHESD